MLTALQKANIRCIIFKLAAAAQAAVTNVFIFVKLLESVPFGKT